MGEAGNHIFLPWVQPGVAANIPDQATEKLNANQPAVISLPVKLVVNADTVEKTVRLYGPGDVTGIDPQQVVRVEPRHRTMDFEPNYFPAIEFDRPDFPWLFTPAKGDAQERLRPWLCLVVVRKQQGVELRPVGGLPLQVLDIKSPARPGVELPDLSECYAWAHAQITGADKSALGATLAGDPARSVSRLLCPRRLEPATEYIACVVPAFEVGRKAGLNLPIQPADEQKLDPSWLSGDEAPAEITLPVYYSWEFHTGADGDFEELVRRLEPRVLPEEVGKRPMDISQPGFTMQPAIEPDAPGATLGLEGALRVVNSEADAWPDSVRAPFQAELIKILNTPWEIATREGEDKDPIVAPPVYGCWQAARHEVAKETAPSPPADWPPTLWLDELNLDPRNRATAAMGTQVIQEQQEQLMASAWEQLGEIQKVNQRLRQAQLSRAVNNLYYAKSFSRFSVEAFFKVVAPAQSRVVLEESSPNNPPVKTLLVQKFAQSPVPISVVSAPLRRMSRPRGAINRQYSKAGASGVVAIFELFNVDDTSRLTAPTARERGEITIDKVSDRLPGAAGLVWNPQPPPGHWERARADEIQMHNTFRYRNISSINPDSTQPTPSNSREFYEAVTAHQNYLSQIFMSISIFIRRETISAAGVQGAALASLDPNKTVNDSVQASFTIKSPQPQTGDPLDPIMDSPTFPQPMYEALRDLSQDYLFPGLEYVPPNTVQLLQTNGKFIESFMVGLNAEMSRELLWRGYPTDQRGTYFRQFWDTAAAGAQAQLDITPIHEWGDRALGTTAVGAGGDKLVLLIRGELLRRYPNTVIYAVKAVERDIERVSPTDPTVVERVTVRDLSTDPADESHPLFRGTLEPDVTFVGFDLTSTEVVAGLGWYFVLQQQPTEPRFGLDDDPFSEGESGEIPELKTWNDLNWAHLAPSAEALKQLSYVSVTKVQLTPTESAKGIWGRNSAHMAYITKQRPARVAIHATELLPRVIEEH